MNPENSEGKRKYEKFMGHVASDRSAHSKTVQLDDKWYALIVSNDLFVAFELLRAENLSQAQAQTLSLVTALVNPELTEVKPIDLNAYRPADAKKSLELMTLEFPPNHDC